MSSPTIRREQLAGMNIHWTNYSLDAFLDEQARLGFRTIELWASEPHIWIDHASYFDAKTIRHKIEERGLSVHTLTPENCVYPYQVAAKEPDHVARSFGYFSNGIRMAAELGCDYMEINSGWGYWNENRDEAWRRSREMLDRLADVAADMGVVLVMETLRPQESQLVVTLADAKRMFDEINHPNLKVMIDTVAMSVSGETIDQWFDVFGGDIRNMHFVDCSPSGHLVWGDGDRKMSDWVSALNRNGYELYLGQEITDERYMMDPGAADFRNYHNFERYFDEEL